MTRLFAQPIVKAARPADVEFARRAENAKAVAEMATKGLFNGSGRMKATPAPRHGGHQHTLAGPALDQFQPPAIAAKSQGRPAPALHSKVAPLAETLPAPAAELLSMIVAKADEAPSTPIAFSISEVANAFDLAPAGAEATIGTLLRRGLIVESRNALGSRDGYRPSLPKA